mmetsp:Transcript_18803/g.34842  ORF Transcript_18803/g.34842 Transcript_18803/m.34842 type:complete len:212 (-) Transcript_18803:588-1223(-)
MEVTRFTSSSSTSASSMIASSLGLCTILVVSSTIFPSLIMIFGASGVESLSSSNTSKRFAGTALFFFGDSTGRPSRRFSRSLSRFCLSNSLRRIIEGARRPFEWPLIKSLIFILESSTCMFGGLGRFSIDVLGESTRSMLTGFVMRERLPARGLTTGLGILPARWRPCLGLMLAILASVTDPASPEPGPTAAASGPKALGLEWPALSVLGD